MDDEAKMKNKSGDQALDMPIPHLYQSFPVCEYSNNDGLGKEIRGMSKKVDAIMEDEVETSDIRDSKPGEKLKNCTSTPLLIPRTSWLKEHMFIHIFEIGSSLEEA